MRAILSEVTTLVVTGTLLLAAPVNAEPPASRILVRAEVNDDLSVVNLTGEFGAGMPDVSVGGQRLQPLTNDGTTVSARLPAGFAPGRYVVGVTTADGRTASIAALLVVGAPGAAATPAPRPADAVVESATVNADGTVLELTGHFGPGMPTVALDGAVSLQPLTNDGTSLSVVLPPGVQRGKHLVLVKTPGGRSGALQVVIGQ